MIRILRILRHPVTMVAALLASYMLAAYFLLPAAWTRYEHQPRLEKRPVLTANSQGIPGDPLNVGLVGSRADVVRALDAAGWYPADPITLRTSVKIIGSVLMNRPYREAPVSYLYYEGRREDLAFEKPDGASARRRQHVRLWQVLANGIEGRVVWLGAATFDRGVGLSRYTGQVTHDIAPDIDAERARLIDSLTGAHVVEAVYQVTGIGPTLFGRNGEGDAYYTDGEIWLARLTVGGEKRSSPPDILAAPTLVQWKDAIWNSATSTLAK